MLPEMDAPTLGTQVFLLFLLAMPVACIAWTVTHEEVFREPREYCVRRSRAATGFWERKCFYLFTCEYCLSHWVAVGLLVVTRFTLIYPDWRGYVVSGFSLVWVANFYMSLYGRLRVDIKEERLEIEMDEIRLRRMHAQPATPVALKPRE